MEPVPKREKSDRFVRVGSLVVSYLRFRVSDAGKFYFSGVRKGLINRVLESAPVSHT